MTKRKLTWIIVILLSVTSLIAIVLGINAIHDITLSKQEVQNKIDGKLPLEKNDMVLKNLQVNLATNSLSLAANFEGKKWGQEFNASINAIGTPYYNNIDGTFHFRPSQITVVKIEIKGEAVSTKIKKFIDKYVDSSKINQNANDIGLKVEEWVKEPIENSTVLVLQRIPVYTLPDTLKGNAVRMFLKSVEINDDGLTLHLSFWQFTKMIILYALIFLIALVTAFALTMNPGWGLTFLFISSIGDIGN